MITLAEGNRVKIELVTACELHRARLAKFQGNGADHSDLMPVERHGFGSLALAGFGLCPFPEVSGQEPPFDIASDRGDAPALPYCDSGLAPSLFATVTKREVRHAPLPFWRRSGIRCLPAADHAAKTLFITSYRCC